MILTKKIKIKIVPTNYKRLKELGYEFKMGNEIEINVEHLTENSKTKIKVKCDNCGKEKIISYSDYMTVYNKKNCYYCSKCKGISIKKGTQIKYGVDNVFQLKDVKEKIIKTSNKKYGYDHHLQNKDILQKQIDTNQERYGVNFIPELKKYTNENFIKKCKEIHGNLYNYDDLIYIDNSTKVKIKCKKHGYFYQRPYEHIIGIGCPKCKTSKGENFILKYLEEHNIKFEYQKKFKDCKYKNELPFDFYLPDYNMCIEYDGIQHDECIEFFGGEDEFEIRKIKDRIKNEYCKEKGIILERITYSDDIKYRLDIII